MQACHKHHKADNDLYDRIRKESRKKMGSSASAKKPKPAPKEDPKDLENQLEKARLEGVREGLEKREASLSSAQSSSMAKCYVMNPLNGMMHQIRVLLDSGANLSLINNDAARKIGLPGDTVNIILMLPGRGCH